MEELLNNYNNVLNCYNKNSTDDVLKMNNIELTTICLEERKNFIRVLVDDSKVRTKNLIHERLKILNEREHLRAENRKAYLETIFK